MQTLQGVVNNLNHSTQISGGGRSSPVTTTHVATFELNGQPVTLHDRSSIILNNGDNVRVAGKRGKDGIFKAYAYRNSTKNVHGGSSGRLGIITGAIFLILPLIVCGITSIAPEYAAFNLIFCTLPITSFVAIFGGVLLFFALRQRAAWNAVA